MSEPSSNRGLIIGIIVATVLLFAGFTWLVVQAPSDPGTNGEPQEENVTFNDAGAPHRGPYEDKDVKVAVHMYSDLQCPACRAQEGVLGPIMKEYQDKGVRFFWKDFPLTQIHQNARTAANAARCADEQGWFWTYRDALFAEQPSWASLGDPRQKLIDIADASITDKQRFKKDKFEACVRSNAHDGKVAADMNEGLANKVDRTPTFFIGKKRYFGMMLDDWKTALDKALSEVTASATSTTP